MPPRADTPVLIGRNADLATALGWLAVVEAAKLASPRLLADAARVGLDQDFGARYLGDRPKALIRSWRTFLDALSAVNMNDSEKRQFNAAVSAAMQQLQGSLAVLRQ